MSALRIAILAHSTNPRGGVVHALELGDALTRLGHDVAVHAPDASGRGFFRPTLCRTVSVKASPLSAAPSPLAGEGGRRPDEGYVGGIEVHPSSPLRGPSPARGEGAVASPGIFDLVNTRAADYVRHFEAAENRAFDIYHAQDGISANALATLKARGLIDGFVRTVHHIDDFDDRRVALLQRRAITEADAHCVVSAPWRERLRTEFGLTATIVGNGVDGQKYSSRPKPGDLTLRTELGLLQGPIFLAVGGVEERKNTLRILEAFTQVFAVRPSAQLVIAGGVSLLDHGAYQAAFAEMLAGSGLPAHATKLIGRVEDADMPALYRNADALIFPSVKEGFGLVVLEAMACGLPVVTSAIPPFTDYLGEHDCLWCTPDTTQSIADAMLLALHPGLKPGLVRRGRTIAARHDWLDVARAHLPVYASLKVPAHA